MAAVAPRISATTPAVTPARPRAPAATPTVRSKAQLNGPPTIRLSTTTATQPSAAADGKRMYRTSDGKMVELPADMTSEEAAKLEREAQAAQTKLGKGPPPQPVPDVK